MVKDKDKDTEKTEFEEVWVRVALVTRWEKQGQLADFLNITPQTVSGAKGRGSFPVEWAFKVASAYGASTDWLLTGKGNMRSITLEDEIELYSRRKSNEPCPVTRSDVDDFFTENPLFSQVVYSWPQGKPHYFGKDYTDLLLTADLFSEVVSIKNEFGYKVRQEHDESFMLLLFSIIRLGTEDEIRIASEFLRRWVEKNEGKIHKNS
ncbi:MAG: helix-turn-helix domain-containing protein [Desulfobulbus sp.]|nr:helix-turn-helix domain-containing protein [Desulfobulbus sp.]